MDLLEHLKKRLRALGALDGRLGGWLVGVSGGVDSVCLLHLLIASRLPGLQIVHLDHGLRGEASTGDAVFVEELAAKLGLPFHARRVDAAVLARENACGIEEAGRRARQSFFADMIRETQSRAVFLAHHADDQAETVLWNLLRGSGLRGAGGIRERADLQVQGTSLALLRPLLEITKSQLLDYAKLHGLAWREDATNAEPEAATRNRLRHELIPQLERALERPVVPALARFAELAREDHDYLATLAEGEELHLAEKMEVARLAKLPRALQRRVIQLWLSRLGCRKIGFAEVESILSLTEVGEGGERKVKMTLRDGRTIARSKMQLSVENKDAH